jgi:hypothetical protein
VKKVCSILFCLCPLLSFGQLITTIAGNGSSTFSGEGTPASLAHTPSPGGGAFDKKGNYYFVDYVNSQRVRKITPSGIISTVAGNGMGGFAGDGGPATDARLNGPSGVALDTAGNIYIADLQNARIRKVNAATGLISTIAGTGTGTYDFDDVPATSASIWGPQDICLDKSGNLYIADAFNYRIRKVTPSGIISTYAGNGIPGYAGEGVVATASSIGLPVGLCCDTAGNIYIASNTICRVTKISHFGLMSTVAGNGGSTFIGDGIAATSAQIVPFRVFADSLSENIYIADRNSNRVYEVVHSTGILNTIAGIGTPGDAGDGGLATAASLFTPTGVVTDVCGNLYIPTTGSLSVLGSGRRIRKVTFNPSSISTVSITCTPNDTVCAGTPVTFTASTSGGSTLTFKWYKNGDLVAGATSESFTYTPTMGDSVRCVYTGVDICSFTGYPSSNTINLVVTPLTPPTIALSSLPATSAAVGSTVTVNAAVGSVGGSYNIRWYKNSVPLGITSVPVTTYIKGAGVDVITAKVSSTDPTGCYDTTTSLGITINALPGGVDVVQTGMPVISLYPNPAADELHVTGIASNYRILSAVGQVLQRGEIHNEVIQLSALTPGVYLLEASNIEGLKSYCRFVKK